MENANFNQLVSFVFGIANDCLVDVYDVGDYRKIILPKALWSRMLHCVPLHTRRSAIVRLLHCPI